MYEDILEGDAPFQRAAVTGLADAFVGAFFAEENRQARELIQARAAVAGREALHFRSKGWRWKMWQDHELAWRLESPGGYSLTIDTHDGRSTFWTLSSQEEGTVTGSLQSCRAPKTGALTDFPAIWPALQEQLYRYTIARGIKLSFSQIAILRRGS